MFVFVGAVVQVIAVVASAVERRDVNLKDVRRRRRTECVSEEFRIFHTL